jgi:hypothetical protein
VACPQTAHSRRKGHLKKKKEVGRLFFGIVFLFLVFFFFFLEAPCTVRSFFGVLVLGASAGAAPRPSVLGGPALQVAKSCALAICIYIYCLLPVDEQVSGINWRVPRKNARYLYIYLSPIATTAPHHPPPTSVLAALLTLLLKNIWGSNKLKTWQHGIL